MVQSWRGISFTMSFLPLTGAYWAEDSDDDPWTLYSDPSADGAAWNIPPLHEERPAGAMLLMRKNSDVDSRDLKTSKDCYAADRGLLFRSGAVAISQAMATTSHFLNI